MNPKDKKDLVRALEAKGFKMHESIYPLVIAAYREGLETALDCVEGSCMGPPHADPGYRLINSMIERCGRVTGSNKPDPSGEPEQPKKPDPEPAPKLKTMRCCLCGEQHEVKDLGDGVFIMGCPKCPRTGWFVWGDNPFRGYARYDEWLTKNPWRRF